MRLLTRRLTHKRKMVVEFLEDRTLPSATTELVLDPGMYDPSRILVRFRPNVAGDSEIFALQGTRVGAASELVAGLHPVYLSDGMDVSTALESYRANPDVLYAEPDYRVQLNVIPNDPQFNSQWALNNTGQTGGTADADIDGPEAWDALEGNNPVIVAVIDTGVDYTHPDLANRMWVNPGEIANGIDDDGNGFVDDIYGANFVNNSGDPLDDHFHGTHVAGTIAAQFNNGLGVSGVTGSANVRIMGLKFLDSGGGGFTSDAIAAIEYAWRHGAKISNNSWGGGGFSTAMRDAIAQAGANGHLFVAAAGNDGSDNDAFPFYPSGYNLSNIIAVAATDHNDQLAWFSNYGATTVDVAAPGVNILSTFPTYTTPAIQQGGYSTNYDDISGTSMATPHASGVAALIIAQHPEWTVDQVKDQLLSTVDAIPALANATVSGGRINAALAIGPDTQGPRVTAVDPAGSVTGPISVITVTFNEPVLNFTAGDVSLTNPDGASVGIQQVIPDGSGRIFTLQLESSQSIKGAYLLEIGPADITDGSGNAMNQDGDSTNGELTDDKFTSQFTIADELILHSDDVPAPVFDYTTTFSYLPVAQHVDIGQLKVGLDLTHPYDLDVQVYLVHVPNNLAPSDSVVIDRILLGDYVLLSSFNGGFGSNYTGTIFDDNAAISITQGAAPFTGPHRPQEPLSYYSGRDAYGTFIFAAEDWYYDFIGGSIDAWYVNIVPDGPPAPNQPPTANAGGSYSGNEGTVINLNGSNSSDSDGNIVLYEWDLDNDGQYDDATGATTTFTKPQQGVFTVGLRVTDDDGASATDQATVTFNDTNPAAQFTFNPAAPVVATNVNFIDQTSSHDGIIEWAWDFNGDNVIDSTAQHPTHMFLTPGTFAVKLTVREADGDESSVTKNVTVSDSPPPSDIIGETGTVTFSQSGSNQWHTVNLNNSYTDPIVILGPPSGNGGHQAVVRVRNVTSNSFQFQLDEWDYLDGRHTEETVSYMVVEKGDHTLANGTRIVAGSTSLNQNWASVNLSGFSGTPVVLSQTMSVNESSAVTTRQRNVTSDSFQLRLQEEEAADGFHASETVGWIAVATGSGNAAGVPFEVGLTGDSVTHKWNTGNISFSQSFTSAPAFFANMQTFDGGDTAAIRYRNLDNSDVQIRVEEEKSLDNETNHTSEDVGFAAFAIGNLEAESEGGSSLSALHFVLAEVAEPSTKAATATELVVAELTTQPESNGLNTLIGTPDLINLPQDRLLANGPVRNSENVLVTNVSSSTAVAGVSSTGRNTVAGSLTSALRESPSVEGFAMVGHEPLTPADKASAEVTVDLGRFSGASTRQDVSARQRSHSAAAGSAAKTEANVRGENQGRSNRQQQAADAFFAGETKQLAIEVFPSSLVEYADESFTNHSTESLVALAAMTAALAGVWYHLPAENKQHAAPALLPRAPRHAWN